MKKLVSIRFLSCLLAGFSLLAGACLNPIAFDPDSLPAVNVKISGSISIDDVAVFWLVNRTKDINVTKMTISRDKRSEEESEDPRFIKTYTGRPQAGTSHASYHVPTELPYRIEVEYTDGNTTGIVYPSFEVQFPRAQNYMYYLYWDRNGALQLVDETRVASLPSDPDKNYGDEPDPASHTLVVVNVTLDQPVDRVLFEKSLYAHELAGEPKPGNQQMVSLQAGSYTTTVSYIKDGVAKSITKNTIITAEQGSMAFKTNFLYFYKTNTGGYNISTTWPPIPDDSSSDNSPESALVDEYHGILEIVNNAMDSPSGGASHLYIANILINGVEYPNTNPDRSIYLGPGWTPKRYILATGPAAVRFKPTDESGYGPLVAAEIKAGQVTTIVYTNSMGNPGGNFPGDIGYGAGKIKITNNSTAVVIGVTVHEGEIITQTSKFVKLPYGSFNPPSVINPSRAAEVDVVGTGTTIDIKNNPLQRIQVELRTADDEDLVLVERIAKVDGQVVNIVIDNASLGGGGSYGRTGSKVTVKNETLLYPTTITSMYVFNMTYPNEMMLYPLNISSPTPHTQDLYVLDSLLLPIRDANRNHQYGVSLTVSGNGNSLTITKAFEPDSILYSKDPDNHLRTVTLTDDDLPDELRERFVPVTYIGLNPNPYKLTAYTKSDANEVNFEFNGSTSFNLNTPGLVVVSPAGATKTEPILWTLDPAAHSLVSFNSTSGHFTVTGIIPEGQRKVRLNAVIQEAAGTVANKIDFTGYVEIEVVYENIISSRPVTAITLVTGVEYKIVDNGYFDLRQLVQGFEPNPLAGGHNLNGRPITKDDIVWYIDGIENTTGYIYAPETPGTGSVMVRAVLPAVNSSGTQVNSTTVDAYTTLKLKRGMKIIITY